MWTERHDAVSRRYPDLVAVFESRGGSVGLLLRQTMVPLPEERGQWLRETRRIVRSLVSELRKAGPTGECLVLQWRPLPLVAEILHRWTPRYDGDPARRAEITRVVDRYLEDRWFVVTRAPNNAVATVTPLFRRPAGLA